MHLSTPPQPRFRPSSGSGSGTPYTPTNARARQFASRPSQLSAAASSSSSSETSTPTTLARDKGTPVGRLLAREAGQATPRSPRRVRQRTWVQKSVRDQFERCTEAVSSVDLNTFADSSLLPEHKTGRPTLSCRSKRRSSCGHSTLPGTRSPSDSTPFTC